MYEQFLLSLTLGNTNFLTIGLYCHSLGDDAAAALSETSTCYNISMVDSAHGTVSTF